MSWYDFLRKRRFEGELDEELRFHLESQIRNNIEAGMDPCEARRQALLKLGGLDLIKEDCRDVHPSAVVETLLKDLRYGLRMLRRSPAFTAVAVLSLALGIGANAAVFSLIDGIWTRPMPVPRGGELVRVFTTSRQSQQGYCSYPDYLDYREHARALAGLAAVDYRGPILWLGGSPVDTYAEVVSDNYFSVLGVQMAFGRPFREERNQPPSIVLSHRFFQSRFGGDARVIGQTVRMGGNAVTIVGVAPTAFVGTRPSAAAQIWVPFSTWDMFSPGERSNRETRWLSLFGRLSPGASVAEARQEVGHIARNLARAYPESNKEIGADVWSDRAYRLHSTGWYGAVLLALVGSVLLVATANIAILLLARAEIRRREIALRLTLGAGRFRLVRQLLTESCLLATLGALCGILLGGWLIRLLPALLPADAIASGIDFRLDGRVLEFTLFVSLIAGVVFGLFPAFASARADLTPALKGSSPRSNRRSRSIPRNALVAGQIAVSLVLMVTSALLARSLWNAMHADLGFERKNLLVLHLERPYRPNSERHDMFTREIVEHLRSVPGVRNAAVAMRCPFQGHGGGRSEKVAVLGPGRGPGEESLEVRLNVAGAGYFKVMGTRLLRGREFDEHDTFAARKVAIINETGARRFWPSADPIGKRLQTGGSKGPVWDIVGVAQDAKINVINERPEPYLYFPYTQMNPGGLELLVETGANPLALLAPVRARLRETDKEATVYSATTLHDLIGSALDMPRVTSTLVAILGSLALLLAAVGLYGVVSYFVASRTRNIGIRMALGAQRRDVLRDVLRHGIALAVIGIAIGTGAALAGTRLLSALLYGVSPSDPAAFAAACCLMLAVALAASYVPARRATRVDPVIALRNE